MSEAKDFVKRQLYGRVHRGTPALNLLLEYHPAMLAFSMFVEHIDDQRESEYPGGIESDIWNDGRRIRYSPKFKDRTLYNQVAVVAKQLMKIALCHAARARRMAKVMGDRFEPRLYNLASDLVIHQTIEANKKMDSLDPTLSQLLERHSKWSKEVGLPEPKHAAPSEWSSEHAYHFLVRWREQMKETLEKQGQGQADLDWLEQLLANLMMDIDFSSQEAMDGESSDSIKAKDDEAMRNWRNRFERARAGDKPGGMLRKIQGELPEAKTPWNEIIRAQTLRAVSFKPKSDWTRPSRNMVSQMFTTSKGKIMPFSPAVQQKAPAPKIGICADTSGSMDEATLAVVAANINAVQRAKKTQLRLVIGDAAVEEVVDVRPEQLRDVCKNVRFKGGGGTDFRPLFEEIMKWKPDVIVFLTDLMGTFPETAPRCPVIWAVQPIPGMNLQQQVPFGSVIMLE
jgi:predicted metal-dependent peptidase